MSMSRNIRSLSIRELQALLQDSECQITNAQLDEMHADPRTGVRRLAQQFVHRLESKRKEAARINELTRHERQLWAAGASTIAGVDEVGVGPLAGPVVAAAVIMPAAKTLFGIDDSKRLSSVRREQLTVEIHDVAQSIGIGMATVHEIDRLNVYQAGLLAMKRAVEALTITPQQVLVDARTIPGIPFPQRGITGGDRTCYSIAAASIIAKTHRDRLMVGFEGEYPGYGFAKHKGYPTQEHRDAIARLGLTPIHRRSFNCLPADQA